MIKKIQRPLIDRPRYVSRPPVAVNNNKPINKPTNKSSHKRKAVDKKIPKRKMKENQIQQTLISGSVNPIDEAIKNELPLKSPPPLKRKPKTSRKPRRAEKDDSGMFKQMKDKLIGKSKKQG